MRITWITPAPLQRRVDGGYASEFASLRYRVIMPIKHLPAHRHSVFPATRDAAAPPEAAALDADLVIFSKSMNLANTALARQAQARGAAVLFDICDNYFDSDWAGAHFREMAGLADQVVCNTEEMARVAAPFCARPPLVIEDPYEGPRGAPAFAPGERLNLLWFGHSTNLDGLEPALRELASWAGERPATLHILTQLNPGLEAVCEASAARYSGVYAMTCETWTLEAQWRALAACDVVVIPSLPTPEKMVKSANRMIEALWAGRPVIAHPLPAYLPFAKWTPVGPNLTEGMQLLDRDREVTPRRVAAAQAYIEERYAPAVVAGHWARVLAATNARERVPR